MCAAPRSRIGSQSAKPAFLSQPVSSQGTTPATTPGTSTRKEGCRQRPPLFSRSPPPGPHKDERRQLDLYFYAPRAHATRASQGRSTPNNGPWNRRGRGFTKTPSRHTCTASTSRMCRSEGRGLSLRCPGGRTSSQREASQTVIAQARRFVTSWRRWGPDTRRTLRAVRQRFTPRDKVCPAPRKTVFLSRGRCQRGIQSAQK
jgi:hypothetical protein